MKKIIFIALLISGCSSPVEHKDLKVVDIDETGEDGICYFNITSKNGTVADNLIFTAPCDCFDIGDRVKIVKR